MNLPNKLTVLRIALIPVFVAFLMINTIPHNYFWAMLVFVVASLTDLFDGKIARKYDLVTDFGKLMDPLADKMLVTSAIVLFLYLGLANPIAVIIILARDMMINSMRLIAASDKGKVLAAGFFGKLKTASQMTGIITVMVLKEVAVLGFIPFITENADLISNIIMWVISILTLASGIDYMVKYRKYIQTK